jgi:hypothetical protein
VDLPRLATALGRIQPLWLAMAGLTFGGGLLCGAARWGTALKAGQIPVRRGPLLRASFAGHFFNSILLGPAGGDVAKSALFARWHGSPGSAVYASSLLDRAFSLGGSVLFTALVLGLALHGPLPEELRWQGGGGSPWLWAVPLAAAATLAAVWKRPAKARAFASKLKAALQASLRRLRDRPALAVRGCLAGLVGQLCNTAVLPLCLAAVAAQAVPWSDTIWTFPLIAMVAVLPVTVGGSGVREGAALFLLARYGIPAEDIVAAGLLTLGVYLGWAGIGAAVGWREEMAFLRELDRAREGADEASLAETPNRLG